MLRASCPGDLIDCRVGQAYLEATTTGGRSAAAWRGLVLDFRIAEPDTPDGPSAGRGDRKGTLMIIWGWGRRTFRRYGPVVYQTCSNCHNTNWFNLIGIRRWFTLFFIPIIPYSSKHTLICPVCSRGRELGGADLAHAKQLNQIAVQYTTQVIPGDEYKRRLAELTGATPPTAALEAQSEPPALIKVESASSPTPSGETSPSTEPRPIQ